MIAGRSGPVKFHAPLGYGWPLSISVHRVAGLPAGQCTTSPGRPPGHRRPTGLALPVPSREVQTTPRGLKSSLHPLQLRRWGAVTPQASARRHLRNPLGNIWLAQVRGMPPGGGGSFATRGCSSTREQGLCKAKVEGLIPFTSTGVRESWR